MNGVEDARRHRRDGSLHQCDAVRVAHSRSGERADEPVPAAVEDEEAVPGPVLVCNDPVAVIRAARVERDAFRLVCEHIAPEYASGECSVEAVHFHVARCFIGDQQRAGVGIERQRFDSAQATGAGCVAKGSEVRHDDAAFARTDPEALHALTEFVIVRRPAEETAIVVRHEDVELRRITFVHSDPVWLPENCPPETHEVLESR